MAGTLEETPSLTEETQRPSAFQAHPNSQVRLHYSVNVCASKYMYVCMHVCMYVKEMMCACVFQIWKAHGSGLGRLAEAPPVHLSLITMSFSGRFSSPPSITLPESSTESPTESPAADSAQDVSSTDSKAHIHTPTHLRTYLHTHT